MASLGLVANALRQRRIAIITQQKDEKQLMYDWSDIGPAWPCNACRIGYPCGRVSVCLRL